MGKVTIRKNPDIDKIELERATHFKNLPFEERWNKLMHLITLSNGLKKGNERKRNKITLTKKGVVINHLK